MPQHLEKAKHISNCLELAILFEISANKPGNVNLVVGFEGTRYEHFLVSAVAAASSFEYAAERGIAVSQGKINISDVGLGQIIERCVANIDAWQHGGNTLLGTVILLSPIAVAAGIASVEERLAFDVQRIRENLKGVVESTTAEDAINFYRAIGIAKPSGLNRAPELDVNDPHSIERILREDISLYRVFQIASKWDKVCSEWVENYPITFDFAYPFLSEQIRNAKEPYEAIVQTFLRVLAEYPDTFITRKAGLKKSKEVSSKARTILQTGLATEKGKQQLQEFDRELRFQSNLLNPGTTADIIAAALALCVLDGYRP